MIILSESIERVLDPTIVSIISLVTMAILFVTMVTMLCYGKFIPSFILFIIIIVLIIITIKFGTSLHKKVKVVLSDNYPVVMLYDKYKVIERDGKLWTLQERKPMVEESEEWH